MAYSGTILNGSSVSFVHTLHSQDSHDSFNITYDTQHTKPYLYKPVIPIKSRLRPALPTVFLQLPGDDACNSSPWTKQPRRQASYETFNSDSKEQLLVQELTDTTGFVRNPSPAESANQAAMPSANMHRFSTCVNGASSVSLLDPGMMQLDEGKTLKTSQLALSSHRRRMATTSDNDSSDSEGVLREWSTPRIAKAPTLRISSKELPSLPSGSTGPIHYRSASSCSMYRDDSNNILENDDASDILHIRGPNPLGSESTHQRPSAATVKRRNMEIKSEKQAIRTAKLVQTNLKIKLDDPKAKDSTTTIDSLFGIGKEESKAQRCGYAGLGIAYDKRTWKATDDYQSL